MKYAKKPFPKLGILIIILAIIGIYLANTGSWLHYSATWKSGSIEEDFYKDLEGTNNSLIFFFNPPYSFIHGMSADYFLESPALALYGLYSLLIIGFVIIFFGLIDKKKNFSIINFHTIQFILYSLIIVPCVFIITSVIRFIQVFIITGHNIGYYKDLLETILEDPSIIPKATPIIPYLFIILFLIVITITFTVMDSNLRIILEENKSFGKKIESTKIKVTPKKKIFRYNEGDGQV
jgi:hypothetical protein